MVCVIAVLNKAIQIQLQYIMVTNLQFVSFRLSASAYYTNVIVTAHVVVFTWSLTDRVLVILQQSNRWQQQYAGVSGIGVRCGRAVPYSQNKL